MLNQILSRIFATLFAMLFVAGLSSAANAVPVSIDPGGYSHRYGITNFGVPHIGPKTLDLSPGNHTVYIGSANAGTITVDASGAVTSNNPAAFTGGQNALTFNNSTVTFDPGGYAGNSNAAWAVRFVSALTPKQVSQIVLVPGVSQYSLILGPVTGGVGFRFDLDASGNVTVPNGVSAVGGANTLSLNSMTVTVDPRDYAQNSNAALAVRFIHVFPPKQIGTVVLVPGVDNYPLIAGALTSTTGFRFDLSASGAVSVQNGISAQGGQQSLALNTTDIFVDPGSFAGFWEVRFAHRQMGAGVTRLPPSVTYLMVADGASSSFSVLDPCAVDPSSLSLNSATLDMSCTPPSLVLTASDDAFISQTRKNSNFGAINQLDASGNARERILVGFDPQSIASFGSVTKATLRLTIVEPPTGWVSGALAARPLAVEFVQGNGNGNSSPGTGNGATWNCAVDTEIANNRPDCDARWDGGSPGLATAAPVPLSNGQTGVLEWDVTADVQSGITGWILMAPDAAQNAKVGLASLESAVGTEEKPSLVLE